MGIKIARQEAQQYLLMARYYSPESAFRFLSVDPSTKSIDPSDPQSWNRYNYTSNSPLRYVDPTGKYLTPTHNYIIDKAFPGLSKEQRKVLKASSKRVDQDQSPGGSYKHGMRAPGQSKGEAAKKSNDFIQSNEGKAQEQQRVHEAGGGEGLSNDALSSFGNALHTVTDSLSPAHKGQQEWKGTEGIANKAAAVDHFLTEASPSRESLKAAVAAAQEAFKETFGDEAAAAAIRKNDD